MQRRPEEPSDWLRWLAWSLVVWMTAVLLALLFATGQLPSWVLTHPAAFLVGVLVGVVVARRWHRLRSDQTVQHYLHHTVEVRPRPEDEDEDLP